MAKEKSVETVEEFNSGLCKEIARLEKHLSDLKKSYKSEASKPQATLQQCIVMNRKAKGVLKVQPSLAKPKTESF